MPSNVAKAIIPMAVRWASTFLHKTESNIRSNSKVNIEPILFSIEENQSISSNNTLFNFDQTFSSSSELNLSLALQSINDISSLPLSALDNQEYLTTDEEENHTSLSITISQVTSDNESVLYLRLPNELNIGAATLDSDLERIDR
jgi:hypothetical protein